MVGLFRGRIGTIGIGDRVVVPSRLDDHVDAPPAILTLTIVDDVADHERRLPGGQRARSPASRRGLSRRKRLVNQSNMAPAAVIALGIRPPNDDPRRIALGSDTSAHQTAPHGSLLLSTDRPNRQPY